MNSPIVTISNRGQITIPPKARKAFNTKYLTWRLEEGNKLVFEPLQTREDFLQELQNEIKDWEKNGGYSFEKVMEESNRLP